jgi:hypothetical protein
VYTQIVGYYGPQAAVIAHLLKRSGVFFNDASDDTFVDTFTRNSLFEDYYRPYIDTPEQPLPADVAKEFYSFLRQADLSNTASVNKTDWVVFDQVAARIRGRLIFVAYSIAGLEREFPAPVAVAQYAREHEIALGMLAAAQENGWETITLDYDKFVAQPEYRTDIFNQLSYALPDTVDTVMQLYHDQHAMLATKQHLATFTDENPADGLS